MRKLIIVLIAAFSMSACTMNTNASLSSNEGTLEIALEAYNKFLQGDINVINEGDTISIHDIFVFDKEEQLSYNQYAFFDMNGDELPELHVRSVESYDIFTYQAGQLKRWHTDVSYSYPLNDRSIFYMRTGGAPSHVDYAYKLFDFYGNQVFEIEFSKYDASNKENYDENALFIFDGVELPKEEWEKLTERYMSIKSDLIEWLVYE